MRVTAEELKARLDEHIAAAGAGKPVTIVSPDGSPIAQMEPAVESDVVIVPHDPAKRLSDFVPGKRPPRLDFDAVDWLLYDRESERGRY